MRGLMIIAVSAAVLMLGGCEVNSGTDGNGTPGENPEPSPSPWHGSKIALPPEEQNGELAAAIEEARATAEEARSKWSQTPQSQRSRWAVKWAAPVSGDDESGVEYLWVQPIHWSPFRIEGLLASEPVHELASMPRESQPTMGDLVSFPIEELADWVHYQTGDTNGPREGGFTLDVLDARYGKPDAADR